jgi:hypothetical protein
MFYKINDDVVTKLPSASLITELLELGMQVMPEVRFCDQSIANTESQMNRRAVGFEVAGHH